MVDTDYLKVKYSYNLKPKSEYPVFFCKNIIKRFYLSKQSSFLEIGSGRGDFTNIFHELGIKHIYATDYDSKSKIYLNDEINFHEVDMNQDTLPYEDNKFDLIYSKSLIEHLVNPENYMRECFRVLKKGGILITFTPNWETQFKHFYDDITHIRPYTKISLKEAHLLNGFDNCIVEEFFQLPKTWRYPFLKYVCKLIGFFTPIRSNYKILRWSKETMLLSIAKKF